MFYDTPSLRILIYSRTEDGSTYTNHRAAVLDGNMIIVTHTPAALAESIAPKIYAKIHNTNHNITHSTNNNASPQKWVESTQKSNPTSNYKNTNSQKALIIAKRFDVDIDCLDTL